MSDSCDPIDCNLPGSYVSRITQARKLEWVVISSFRGSSWPRDQTHFCTAGSFFTAEPPESPFIFYIYIYIYIYIYTHTHTYTHTYNLILIMPLWGRYYFYYTLFVYFIIPFVYEVRKLSAWLKEAKLESVCLMTKHMLSKTPWCLPTKTTICRQYLKSWKFFFFFFFEVMEVNRSPEMVPFKEGQKEPKKEF